MQNPFFFWFKKREGIWAVMWHCCTVTPNGTAFVHYLRLGYLYFIVHKIFAYEPDAS